MSPSSKCHPGPIMLSRDYLMRQIQQLARFLERVLFLKSSGQPHEAIEVVDEALRELPGLGVPLPHDLSREDLLSLVSADAGLAAERSLVLADLLYERVMLDPEGAGLAARARYALWLYEAAMAIEAIALPLDIGQRLDDLRDVQGGGPGG